MHIGFSPPLQFLPEATIKVLKRTLEMSLGPRVELSYPELVTLLARIANTVNQRPLRLTNVSQADQQEDMMLPITPNMMLLSRSSSESPPMEYSADDRFCARLAFMAQVEKEWWERWIKVVLPTLLIYKRWKMKVRNLEVRKVVLLRYPGQFKSDYPLAKVVEVHPSADGLVRQVSVQFRKRNPKESPAAYKVKPPLMKRVAVHLLHRLELIDQELHQAGDGPNG